jgi:diguanylate cyclase (GGDEF)-like protein
VSLAGLLVGAGLLAVLFPAAFLGQGNIHFEVTVSRPLVLGLMTLLALLNTYLISRRLEIRRVREELISRTIQHELVQQQSFTDPLTEIYNRHSLEDMAGRFISHAQRRKKPLTLLMIDVDHFKEVNTRFGHLTGDVVLANTAALLKNSVRGSDAVFRYGGDEFLVILADTSAIDARHVMERITAGVAEWNRAKHLEGFELSLSIGAAEWSEGQTLDGLLDSADNQTYGAKADHKLSKGKAAGV